MIKIKALYGIYWLTLDKLSLSKVPPESFWPWSYEVEIVASNQFYKRTSLKEDLSKPFVQGLELTSRITTTKETNPTVTNFTINNSFRDISPSNTNRSLNVELISGNQSNNESHIRYQDRSRINFELLSDALIAYTYKQHHLSIGMVYVSIVSKEIINEP